MSRRPVLFLGCLLLSATGERGWAQPQGTARATPRPQWIWSNADPQGDDIAWLRKGFRVDGEVETATLYGACDNAMEVFLNGELVATSGEWTKPIRVTVTSAVKQGRNTLAAVCQNAGGPAGLWLDLVLEQGGRRQMIVTDATWQAASAERDGWTDIAVSGDGWHDAHSFGALGVEPWGPLSGKFVDGTPERALAGDAVEVPEDFRVELLYSVPKARQGSWVSMTIDDAGRIVASDQYGGLYRFTPPPLGSTARGSVEKLAVKLGGAHGLLFAFGSLYGVVADGDEYEHGLWRARDTTGDGELDTVELLKAMRGGGEHGPHAVLVGPDGESLYVIGGNHTELPDGISRFRVPPVWGEDQLLPRRPDPRGHAVGIMAPGGWVCRTDPDGREWELVAAGMRNSYDMAFDEEGELFTFDSDMEWDVGLPWYRPTRVLHLVSGADFGWRNGSGKWPAYYPDSLPGVVDIGLGSPTGVTFGKGTSFPARYRRALYVLDWAYGTIFAVHLEPDGASFKASYEPFAVGKPLPVTDVAIGPDGAMYFTTGGRRMQSGLYRVTWVGEGGDEDALASDPAAAELRATRRALERFHGVIDANAVAEAWPYLDSEDRFVRHAARVAIEHQPVEQWVERVFEERESRKQLEALLALVRVGPPELRERVLDRIVQLRPTSVQEQMDLVRLLGLCFIRMGPPELG
ncbi:MAG: hypothetical protein E2O39_12805, partial [Planctomycetota bacterium]